MAPKRIEILGVPVDCVNMAQAVSAVEEMIMGNRPEMVIAVNPEKVMKARRDPTLMAQLRRASLLIPDGIGVVLAACLLGLGRMERVAGSDLMPAICERAAHKGYRVFLFGASPDVNRKTAEVLHRRFSGIKIVGSQHGYLTEDQMPELIKRINAAGSEVLFVALGSPRQESWMERYLPHLDVKVCQGVGGTFDVLSGQVRRAPESLRKIHLEWLYRLITNPGRIARQFALPEFAFHVLRKKMIG
jgi:N-acetylglucosaminyldiphosphoundecaprenol N-acetyl-beta-D-mannosaminyltransferase